MLNTRPPGAQTRYANPECYGRATNDCCDETNREHYISKKLLELMPDIEAEGFAWGPTKRTVSAKSLRAFVLCKRHNSALSPLDDNITQLYQLMRRWQDRQHVGELQLDGVDLERWALKVMFGVFASGGARLEPAPRPTKSRTPAIPLRHCRILWGHADVVMPQGFYYSHHEFGHLKPTAVRCRVGFSAGKPTPDAIVMSLLGFTWTTTLDHSVPSPHIYRPYEFDLGETGHLQLRWDGDRRDDVPRIKLFEIKEAASQ